MGKRRKEVLLRALLQEYAQEPCYDGIDTVTEPKNPCLVCGGITYAKDLPWYAAERYTSGGQVRVVGYEHLEHRPDLSLGA